MDNQNNIKNIQDNKNNVNNIQDNKNEENEKKGRGLFYFVIAFAVIIIAIVGATYAYFTATAQTNAENYVTAGSANLTLGIETDSTGANYKLIPATEAIAKYAYAEQTEINYSDTDCDEYETDEYGNTTETCKTYKKLPNSTCVDDDGSEVCSTYSFTVVNSNSSSQTLTMYVGTTENQFANLWFAVYTDTEDENGNTVRTRISEPAAVPTITEEEVRIDPIVVTGDEEKTEYFYNLAHPTLTADEPRKTYTVVLWIKEMSGDEDTSDDDQTKVDGDGKRYYGYIRITSGDGTGVTGIIGAAGSYDDTTTSANDGTNDAGVDDTADNG